MIETGMTFKAVLKNLQAYSLYNQMPVTVIQRNVNYVSKLFQPQHVIPKDSKVKKEEALSKSQRGNICAVVDAMITNKKCFEVLLPISMQQNILMLEMGVIRQASIGAFHLLPLGERSLQKLVNIVDQEMNRIDAQKLLMPLLTPGNLWKATGRWDDAGDELFVVTDRHNKEFVLSPTHEEAVTELLSSAAQISYKQLPLRLYQITSKFRDEMRPRFGLLRGKEFIMKDLYTFDATEEEAKETYSAVSCAYKNIFKRIGIKCVKVLADVGVMGGSLSHEYHFLSDVGENKILYCESCNYGKNAELGSSDACPKCGHDAMSACLGIEVAHTFLLGTKYSKPLNARFKAKTGEMELFQMGSYGLGLTRILAASVEALSLASEIRWPISLAPYTVCIIPPKEGSKESVMKDLAQVLYQKLDSIAVLQNNVIIDDRRHLTIGKRLYDAKRLGYPFIVVVGWKAAQLNPEFELFDVSRNVELTQQEHGIIEYLTSRIFYADDK